MSRLSRRLRPRRNGWKATATAADGRRVLDPIPSRRQMVVPDSSKRLSDGLVIETAVVARLLGVKLLTLEGTVLASPAHLKAVDAQDGADSSGATLPGPQYTAIPRPRVGAPSASSEPRPKWHCGTQLALAADLLRESADELRDLRDAEENTRRTHNR
jgi:hypothetical protein